MGRLTLIILATLLLAGCVGSAERPYVRLSNLDPTLAAGAQDISPRPVLRVAPSLMLSPQETLLRYGPLFDYLGKALGRHIEIVMPRSQAEAIDLIRSGGVHLGMVDSYAYVLGRAEFGMEALAAPVFHHQPEHRAYILVRRYSGLVQFSDLKGHTFAYIDPISAAGRLYPEALMLGLNEPSDRFFDRTAFTSSHDKAIEALDKGIVDGAAVDSTAYGLALLRDPDLQRRLRVIETSPPTGAPPLVVHPKAGWELKRQLRVTLTSMDQTEEGRKVLAHLQIERFAAMEDSDYDSVRELATQAGVRR